MAIYTRFGLRVHIVAVETEYEVVIQFDDEEAGTLQGKTQAAHIAYLRADNGLTEILAARDAILAEEDSA